MVSDNNINVPADELLDWFAIKPQTIGWDAILAYDKNDTNTVLLQEYIARQNSDDLMDPITEDYVEGAASVTRTYLFNYVFDHPRLSFENANIAESKAILACRVIDGVRVTFEENGANWDVVTLGAHSPLTAPKLITEINLLNVKGAVNEVGKVLLKLSTGTGYRLSEFDTEHLQKKMGERIQQAFSRLPEEQVIYELNVLKISPDDYLKPKEFVLRTHATPDSQIRDAVNFGDGQVLVFVTMEGGQNGSIPPLNKDMKYLIPDGHSAALILGHGFMVNKIIAEGCKGIINAGNDYTIELDGPAGGFVKKLTVKNGARRLASTGPVTNLPNFRSFELVELVLGLGKNFVDLAPGSSEFYIAFENAQLIVTWEGKKEQPVKITPMSGKLLSNNLGTHWRMKKRFSFVLLPTGDLRMVVDENLNELITRVTPEMYINIPEVAEHFAEIARFVEVKLVAELEAGMTAFLKQSEVIDQFRLHNLLFRGEQPVEMKKLGFPGDLVSFGKVGPTQTQFVIDQLEPYIGLGKTIQFRTVPPTTGLTWEVEPTGGQVGDPGTINRTTGLYTAPALIEGRHLRVRVKATQGTHASFALVSVLAFDVDISPQIQIVSASSSLGREMRAGTLESTALQWKVVNGETTGSRIVKSSLPDGDHTYFAGPADPKKFFSVDEITVSTTQAPVKTQSSHVLVAHMPISENITIKDDPALPDGKIQLEILDRNGNPYPASDYLWEVPIGAGTVDDTGLVTINTSSPHPFIVVSVLYTERDRNYIGCILLPVPMFSVPDTVKMLRA